ncbi:MAG: HNH endonuclease [Candidatus Roizmanbacteria bacterium]|nr:HNH endonuclease [Candidatus Roizmanbacteria bacterium]
MRKRSWTEDQLRKATKNATSIRQVLKLLNLKESGGNYNQIQTYLKSYNIDTSHFTGRAWNKGLRGIGKEKLSLQEVLVQGSSFQSFKLKRRLFAAKLKEVKCEICGWAEESVDGRVPLELDHINGDRMDNRLENLRVLCPNCHSLQPTHRGKNKKTAWWRNRHTRST